MASTREVRGERRKLRVLVISAEGSERQKYIREMFAQMSDDFEPPYFSPAVPQRALRGRLSLLRYCHQANLLPPEEWEAIQTHTSNNGDDESLFDCLRDVPISERRGSAADVELHYSVELWRKAKGLNRGRSTLACTLAHLIAMKRLVRDNMDLILEDNVRAPTRPSAAHHHTSECARRIWATMDASHSWEQVSPPTQASNRPQNATDASSNSCHLRYYGWLGSLPNLEWTIKYHMPNTAHVPENYEEQRVAIFPFPTTQDIQRWERSMAESAEIPQSGSDPRVATNSDEGGFHKGDNTATHSDESRVNDQTPLIAGGTFATGSAKDTGCRQGQSRQRPGGTPLWGAYAYWISPHGYQTLLQSLQSDVGSLLWKGKRMRCHVPKPIDKVMPRRVPPSIHVSNAPAFFRAPMLTSQIHAQWDAEFCKSTEYQFSQVNLHWDDLWLTPDETDIVAHRKNEGVWLTRQEVAKLRQDQYTT